jgi:kumamolisin
MTSDVRAIPLPGRRPPVEGARDLGALESGADVEATIYLRPRPGAPGAPGPGEPFLTRQELAERRGAVPEEVTAVEDFARASGLEILEVDPAGRRVRVRGQADAIGAAFGVRLRRFAHPDGSTYRSHNEEIALPPNLADVVVAVLGLDNRPQARSHLRHRQGTTGTSYSPVAVGAAYGVPVGSTASGVTVGLIELGGGFAESDIATYFSSLGLAAPLVTAVAVDDGSNTPTGSASGPDAEVMLDIEVAGAIALAASIAVYFAPNTDQGFADAVSAAAHDNTNSPAVISISWGGPESTYSAQAFAAFEAALTDAAAVGATVLVAAGDNGSSDGVTGGSANVDYPASSPQVTSCGGTRLTIDSGAVHAEVVWDDLPNGGATGGGVSAHFPLPSWQSSAGVPDSANPGGGPGRGVPDVAGDADPESGYAIRVDGGDTVVGGTSAVAPLYAGLVALAVAKAGGPVGFVNTALYGLGATGFRDVTSGTNGAYSAGPGWDPCTGLGSPKATELIAALAGLRRSAPSA